MLNQGSCRIVAKRQPTRSNALPFCPLPRQWQERCKVRTFTSHKQVVMAEYDIDVKAQRSANDDDCEALT